MQNGTSRYSRLIIVSNRLPFNASVGEGVVRLLPSAGGLVTGLSSYLGMIAAGHQPLREYLWIGWPGSTIEEQYRESLEAKALEEYRSYPICFTEQQMENFYNGFCNKTLWPLFHYFPPYATYQEEYWKQYKEVNESFCRQLVRIVKRDDIIWIHDYHLMLLPALLRKHLPNNPIGFFLHIPFPSFEIFRLLPGRWRKEILEGLLGADLVGFHTYDYTQHFLQCVLRILGFEHQLGSISLPDRVAVAETFPMGIDFEAYSTALSIPEVRREYDEVRKTFSGVKVILSVDRLDYTKGIHHRLEAFEMLLASNPRLQGSVVLVMIVVPSRVGVGEYEQMKKQIEEMIGKINGRFGSVGWTPVIYQFKQYGFGSLTALYNASDVALVTPLRDGMNLIAKEYIASQAEKKGVLILSEMAGAAKELGEAIIINPNNREEIAAAMKEALEMPVEEQIRRNQIMQHRLRRYDVIRWANDFLQKLVAAVDAGSGDGRAPRSAIGASERHPLLRRLNIFVRQLASRIESRTPAGGKLLTASEKRRLLQEYSESRRRFLFLDYDGTLTPIVRTPEQAKPSEATLGLLRSLAEERRNTVVLISGRDKGTMQKWFGGLPIVLVAEHGTWIRDGNATWTLVQQIPNAWKKNIIPILEQYADRLPGAFVEEKEYSVSWHFRSADPEQSQALARELTDHLVTYTANIDLQVVQGKKVIEIRHTGIDKGRAALQLMATHRPDFILAVGDDATDEDLFRQLPKRGHSVRVGRGDTRASHTVPAPADVLALLQEFTRAGSTD